MAGKLNPQNKTKYMVEHYLNPQNNMVWKDIIEQIELLEMNKIIQGLEKHLDDMIGEKDSCSCINFNIIEINSTDSNKSSLPNTFLSNYSGILGIKYY